MLQLLNLPMVTGTACKIQAESIKDSTLLPLPAVRKAIPAIGPGEGLDVYWDARTKASA
jgi:hypothetical protein